MRKVWMLVALISISPAAWGHVAAGDRVFIPKGTLACPYRQDAQQIVNKMSSDWKMLNSSPYRHAYYAKQGCQMTPQGMHGTVTRRRDGIVKVITGPGGTYLWTMASLVNRSK